MQTKEWFYCIPGEDVHGPLPIETIRTAVTAGALSELVHLGRGTGGPWAPIAVVEKLGDGAFGNDVKKRLQAAAQARTRAAHDPTVAGFIGVFGYVAVGIGLLCLAGMFVMWSRGSDHTAILAACALYGIVAGLMFLAVAEALRHLREIAEALRKPGNHS